MAAVHQLGGALTVESRGKSLTVELDEMTGYTRIAAVADSAEDGTTITVSGIDEIGSKAKIMATSVAFAGRVVEATRPAPQWFDVEAISDLIRSTSGDTTVGEFVAQFGTRFKPDNPDAGIQSQDAGALLDDMQSQAIAEPSIKPIGKDMGPNYVAVAGLDQVYAVEGRGYSVLSWAG